MMGYTKSLALLAFVIAGLPGPCSADAKEKEIAPELYKAEVIVTGVEEPERTRGFRAGLSEIIVKLTGRPDLEDSPKLEFFIANPAQFIEAFNYEDRKKGVPVHDEQGTRERSFFLRMTAGAKLETRLKEAGIELWRDRPDFEVLLTVQDPQGDYLVADEAPEGTFAPFSLRLDGSTYRVATARYDGYGPREVLKSIARHRGLPLVFPDGSPGKATESGSETEVLVLSRLFRREKPVNRDTLRFRAKLIPLPSGYWRVETYGWGISTSDPSYVELRECYPYNRSETTFDVALRESLDALSAAARTHYVLPRFCDYGTRL